MVINKSVPLALLCVLLLFQAITSKTSEYKLVNNACIPSERDALLAFKAGLVDPKNRLFSWKGRDCCQWRGVVCSNTTSHVVQLDLRNTYRQYSVKSGWFKKIDKSYALGGEIHSSILSLEQLNYLDLSHNNFNGTRIPEFIGSLKELVYLNLGNAEFGGKIPHQLGNLSKLQYLDLNGWTTQNLYLDLNGWISHNLYSDDVTWLTHLSSLKNLDLSWVNIGSAVNLKRLGIFPRLKTLNLSGCGLDDTTFTLSRVNFTELVTLDLSSNDFENPLSFSWVGNLTNLNNIDLSYNSLMSMKASYLKNLTNLKVLNLRSNGITEDITEFIESSSPHGLQSLELLYNNFNGNLSSWIGHMTSLSILLLSNNNLSGPIPLSIRRLTQLVELNLSNNNFYGTITQYYLSKMTNLQFLLLSGNLNVIIDTNWMPPFSLRYLSLSSCHLGSKFPQWLKRLKDISVLDISDIGIAGDVPIWFWHIFSNAAYLDLSENNLTGVLPRSLEFMSTTVLFLNDNTFKGPVPKLPKNLYALDFSGNALSGPLSFDMKDLILGVLILTKNRLNGSIPQSICQLQNLVYLDLSQNFFVGNVPNCWRSTLDSTKKNNSKQSSSARNIVRQNNVLKILVLSNNNLSGEFPEYITYWSSLIHLNLKNNNFFNSIPPWIGEKLPSLKMLLLGSNKFSGTKPNQLFELKQLQFLDLSHNNLNGIIPHSLKALNAMTITDDTIDDNNPLDIVISLTVSSMTIVLTLFTETELYTKGQLLDFDDNIRNFKSLDFSSNNLVGYIPEEIGALVGLRNLNLSRNKLSGIIPTSIGYLQLLESLDLSTNRLSGSIPSSLSNLTFLSHLNLSYNNLSGRVPSGHQLQTLDDPSIYEGNSGLCGFPLLIECFENRTISQPFASEKEHGYEIYVGAFVGFAIGLLVVYGALLLNKEWGVAYFVFVDKLYDNLYI